MVPVLALAFHLLHSPLRFWRSHSVLAELPTLERTSKFVGTFLLSQLLPGAQVPSQLLLYFLFIYLFCPTQLCGDVLALSEVWDLLPALGKYSVRIVSHVHVFVLYLWEEVNLTIYYSAILIAPLHKYFIFWWDFKSNFFSPFPLHYFIIIVKKWNWFPYINVVSLV